MNSEYFFNPDETFVPKYSQKVYGDAFRGTDYYTSWLIYARFIQGHPYIKRYLSQRQNGICFVCGEELFKEDNFNIVHHRDYLNICTLHKTKESLIRESKPTYLKPERTIPVPNCEYCKRHNKRDFEDCVSRLVILHDVCHSKLHYSEQKLSEWKPIKNVKRDYELITHNPFIKQEKRKKVMKISRICKKCGKKMILKKGPFGEFWGCDNFPKCKYTELC